MYDGSIISIVVKKGVKNQREIMVRGNGIKVRTETKKYVIRFYLMYIVKYIFMYVIIL